MARKTVQLRIYKGREILLKSDGVTPANENQKLTLTYDDTQWKNHLQNLKKTGICKIEIEGFFDGEQKAEIPNALKLEIDGLLKVEQKELTPEQKTIQELTERLNKLEGKGAKKVESIEVVESTSVSDEVEETNSELLEAQSKYLAKFGKEVSNRYKNNLAWILTELEK